MKSYKVLAISLIAVLALCSEAFGVLPVNSGMPTPIVASTEAWVNYSFDGSVVDIPFDLEGQGLGAAGATVYIAIYSGAPASTLVNTWEVGTFSGAASATWDGTDADGQPVPEGYYTFFIYAVNNGEPARLVGTSTGNSYWSTGAIDFSVEPPAFWATTRATGPPGAGDQWYGHDGLAAPTKSLILDDQVFWS